MSAFKEKGYSVCTCFTLANFETLIPKNNPPCEYRTTRALFTEKNGEIIAASLTFWCSEDLAMVAAIRKFDKFLWNFINPLSYDYDDNKYHLRVIQNEYGHFIY